MIEVSKATHSFLFLLPLFLATPVLAGGGPSRPPDTGEELFYTRPEMFSSRPSSRTKIDQTIDRFGPVGIGITLQTPPFTMRVKNVEEGSPAAATGKLKAGQIIETVNGQELKDIDPRIQLGNILTAAEAKDGRVVFEIRDGEQAPLEKVTVSVPVMGPYSETWPLDCGKSEKIVRKLASNFAEEEWSGNIDLSGPKMLFMLSTGEEQDLEVVKEWAQKSIEKNRNFGDNRFVYQWFTSWGGPCLAEYYLRTGDKDVLPVLKKVADAVRRTMYHDGWGGRGVPGHHMGHAGTGTLTMLLLARQCGVDVEEGMLHAALTHFYRFSGKGANPYMDAYPEETFTDNGRNGRLAFAMAAAAALVPDETSVYARARDMLAMTSFYSGTYMNHGHTGGGIGEVWRTAAMGLHYHTKPKRYREFMDNRMWWYDMSRRYNGNFGILGGSSYDKEAWGITMGLTYTAPRKKLCIFGAPRSKYANKYKIPERPWGTPADDAFLSLEGVADKQGNVADHDNEKFAECSGVPMHRKLGALEMSDEELLAFARHPEHIYRLAAAKRIYRDMRVHLIPGLLADKDARLRYVGLRAMPMPIVSRRIERCDPGFPQDKVTDEILERLFEMLNDPEESWYVVDHVIKVLGRRSADELEPHADRLLSFLGHDEQWIRHSALTAIAPLTVDKKTYKKAFAAMVKHVPDFIRGPRGLGSVAELLQEADAEVQKAGVEAMGVIYAKYPGKNANPPGGLHASGMSERNYLNAVANALQSAPGGLDVLYQVGKARYADKLLPHRDVFLNTTGLESSPKMKEVIESVIMNELIPEHVGRNWPNLAKEAKGGSVGPWQDPIMQLASLYSRAGIDDYGWEPFGTDRHNNEWEYFSFDPPEKVKLVNERQNRYREVTYPKGMENWFQAEFDAKTAGWKRGAAPIANFDNKIPEEGGCTNPHCGCGDAGKTLWEKEVLLMRRTFELPPLKEGYRYRLIVGGASHVGLGDGYRVYINGKLLTEAKGYGGRGSGGQPDGAGIGPDFLEEINAGKVLVAATSFLRQHHRSHKIQGHMNIWFEQQKIPPFTEEHYVKSISLIPMTSSDWQDLQDPAKNITDPDDGKFWYDGTFKANKAVEGSWQTVNEVAGIADFVPGGAPPARWKPSIRAMTLNADGTTDSFEMRWSGDTLMNLKRDYRGGAGYEALKMEPKMIEGAEYLFVEAGGFSSRHPAGWKSPWLVMKRK